MGLRVDLAGVEGALEVAGLTACVTGDDEGLRVAVEPVPGRTAVDLAGQVRRTAAEAAGLGVAAVGVAVLPLPRLDNGKVDRLGADALVRGSEPEECHQTRQRVAESGSGSSALVVRVAAVLGRVLGRVLGGDDLDHSFVQLGGDSLSHVQASAALAEVLGQLPTDWHHRPLRALAADPPAPAPARTIETSVLLRAVAVLLILGTHGGLFWFQGGAHTLLAVAGFNASRFGLSAPRGSDRWRRTARLVIGIAVPTAAVALVGLLTQDRYGWGNVAMLNWVVGDVSYGQQNELWFVDALLACVVTLTAVLSVPPLARAWRRAPWAVALAVAVVALVPRYVVLALGDGVLRGIMPTVFWLFALGAAMAHADTTRRKVVTVAVAAAGCWGFFPEQPVRTGTILAGLVLLTLVPAVRLPARLSPAAATATLRVLSVLAAASLYVYLVQFQVIDLVPTAVGGVAASLVVGLLLWRGAAPLVRRLQDLVPATGGGRPPYPLARSGAPTTHLDSPPPHDPEGHLRAG